MSEEQDFELIDSFVAESQDMLDEVEPIFIELRGQPGSVVDEDAVGMIFRLYHSMKGSAAFLGLGNIAEITHKAETLLDLLRGGKIGVDEQFVETQLLTLDAIREIIGHVQEMKNDEGFEESRDNIVVRLEAAIAAGEGRAVSEPGGDGEAGGDDNSRDDSPDAEEASNTAESEEDTPAFDATNDVGAEELPELEITDEMRQRFSQDSAEVLDEAEQALLAMEKADEDGKQRMVSDAFRHLHSFKGNCGFMQLVDLERLSHKMETVLGAMRNGAMPVAEQNVEILLQTLDVLKNGLESVAGGGSASIPNCSVMLDFLDEMVLADAIPTVKGDKKAKSAPADKKQAPKVAAAPAKPTPSTKAASVAPAATEKPAAIPEEKVRAADSPVESAADSPIAKAVGTTQAVRRDIRVDVEKLDSLINLVGELIIAEAMVLRNPTLLGIEDESLDRAVHQLRRVSTELQDIAMSVRMVPLASTFRRMFRLVHDISRKSGKQAMIELVGEETEVDKNVIEQIGDPLVHIIRNSVDHGIESAEERRAAGKDEAGKVILEARHEGGEVWIIIHDDGRGLNRGKILAKAVERGLVRGNPEELDDDEVFSFVFHPGFSTADKVTDLSGRGVGMDVVKKNIEKLNGKVRVKSVVGKGTDVILQIPLTLAIIEGMLVRVAESQYTIPLLSIRESIPRPPKEWITVTPDGNESVLVRGELIPVLRMHEVFRKSGAETDLSKGILVVVQSDNECVALLVDELLGQQETVIKGLSAYLGKAKGVSGCTVLGNGEVSLIIDVGSLVKMKESRGERQ